MLPAHLKIFALVATISNVVLAKDYCNMESCAQKGYLHTMCKYTKRVSPQCHRYQKIGLDESEKDLILSLHNKYRQRVANGQEKRGNPGPQPAAVSMPDLTWDDELATIAQRWALQCSPHPNLHDKCRNVDRFPVGQNVHTKYVMGVSPKTIKLDKLIAGWYDEVKDVDGRNIVYPNAPYTGHYTQMVWAKTTLVGCGAIWHEEDPGWYGVYLVCNYGPSGNQRDEQFYEVY